MMFRSTRLSLARVPALALALLGLFAPAATRAAMYGSVVKCYGGGWPPWFSGTNCAVTATVGAGTPAWLVAANMYIDGTLVRSYRDDGVHHVPYVTWTNVKFDSSHVQDGANHDFWLTGSNSVGQTLDWHQYCPAYNKA